MLQRISLGTSDKHTAHRIASRLNILPADGRDHGSARDSCQADEVLNLVWIVYPYTNISA